jgi:hypothetical protein
LKTFNTIFLASFSSYPDRPAVNVGKLYKNSNDHKPRRCGSGMRCD